MVDFEVRLYDGMGTRLGATTLYIYKTFSQAVSEARRATKKPMVALVKVYRIDTFGDNDTLEYTVRAVGD